MDIVGSTLHKRYKWESVYRKRTDRERRKPAFPTGKLLQSLQRTLADVGAAVGIFEPDAVGQAVGITDGLGQGAGDGGGAGDTAAVGHEDAVGDLGTCNISTGSPGRDGPRKPWP